MAEESIQLIRDDLSIGDMEDFEEATGIPFDEFFDEHRNAGAEAVNKPLPIKVLKALVWITKRKANPEFTLEDSRNVQVSELRLMTGDVAPSRAVRRATAKTKKKPSTPAKRAASRG